MTAQISSKTAGSGREPAILLIHELGGSHRAFRWLVDQLHDLPTIAIDLPGSGSSPALANGSGLVDYADTIAEWLSREIKHPVIIVGIAIGAALGTIMAARRPEAVAGLLYCCMGPAIEARTQKFLEDRCARVLREGLASSVDLSLEISFPASVRVGREQIFEEYRRDLSQARVDGYVDQSYALARSGSTIGEHLGKVQAPVSIVAGAHDHHFTPDIVKGIGALAPHLLDTVMIEDAAHLPHVQAPARLAGLVRNFSDRIAGGTA